MHALAQASAGGGREHEKCRIREGFEVAAQQHYILDERIRLRSTHLLLLLMTDFFVNERQQLPTRATARLARHSQHLRYTSTVSPPYTMRFEPVTNAAPKCGR